jgi:hypothetical protein
MHSQWGNGGRGLIDHDEIYLRFPVSPRTDAGSMWPNRQNFRVGVTRAKIRTTIMSSNDDICVLLIPQRIKQVEGARRAQDHGQFSCATYR